MDWLPILVFFVSYKFAGIYYATGALMLATSLQILAIKFLLRKKVETIHWATLLLVISMGGLTLFFHNENFIKWKPTILYLAFAAAFFVTPFIKQTSLIEIMLASKVRVQKNAWKVINNCFVIFFLLMSVLNTYVFLKYSTETWVNFKMFGTLGITIAFMSGISYYMVKKRIS